jgi:hypothetical protein
VPALHQGCVMHVLQHDTCQYVQIPP